MGFENIPEELKKLSQWVVRKGKTPYNAHTGYYAKAGQSETWTSYDEAVKASVNYDGIGFQFKTDGGIVGIDLDHVLTASGDWADGSEWAQEIVISLATYTEVSPSGTGLHLFVYGDVPESGRKKKFSNNQALEIYKEKRYFTVTGNVFHGSRVECRDKELNSIYKKYFSESPQNKTASSATYQSNDFIDIGLIKDAVFASLWNGERPNGNESSDDIALMNKLAYWCNREVCTMINAFLASPHAMQKDSKHKKKLERQDYLQRTAMQAVEDCTRTAAEDNAQYKDKTLSAESKQKNKKADKIQPLELYSFDAVEYEEPEYIIKPYIQKNKLNILQGDPGIGKTVAACSFAAIVSNENLNPPEFMGIEHGNVLIISVEDDPAILRGRIESSGGILKNCFFPPNPQDLTFDDPRIEECIKGKNIKLIIFDPMQSFLGAKMDMNKANETRPILGRLAAMAKRNGCAVLLLAHMNKDIKGNKPIYRVLGSIDIVGAVRSMMYIDYNPINPNQRILMHTKASNISKGDTLLYRIVDRGGAQWEGVTNIDETDLQNAKQRKESGCEYEDEPIVITVRYLMAQNKDGLCITYTDFFNCAFNLLQMPICGNQSKTLQSEIVRLSKELLQKDHIKINAKKFYPKAYMFDDKIQEPADKAQQRGFEITYYNNTPIYQTAYSKEAFESA